jgi:dUTP pyrophosphatase
MDEKYEFIIQIQFANNSNNHYFMASNVWFTLLHPDAKPPVYSTLYSAAMDFYCIQGYIVPARSRAKIRTGVSVMWQDPSLYLQLQSRSGLFAKHGLSVVGGVIDYDYCQEIHVLMQNHTDEDVHIEKGDRVAQGIFQPRSLNLQCYVQYPNEEYTLYLPYAGAQQRVGGLGSTGK